LFRGKEGRKKGKMTFTTLRKDTFFSMFEPNFFLEEKGRGGTEGVAIGRRGGWQI